MKNLDDKELKIASGFAAPDSYFDNLSASILNKIEHDEPKVIKLNNRFRFYYVAAAILILMLAIPLINKFGRINNSAPETDAIENYLTVTADMPSEEIAELLTDADLERLTIPLAVDDRVIEQALISETDVEYLIN